jgi:sulfate adenylyltransferase subunit 2
MYQHRDRTAQALGVRLIVHKNTSPAAKEAHPDAIGRERCCGYLKTQALLDALKEGEFDAAIGGARRDEERSRAKERIFSFRDKFGQWNPRRQKPELWNLYNGRILNGESIRVFPLSNWSELDVWEYIKRERLALVSLYFAAKREVVVRHGQLIPVASATRIKTEEEIVEKECRFRSLGCMPCSGAILSSAKNIDEIIDEIRGIRNSERSQRLIDYDGEGSMEKKKREGYF